MPKRHVTKILQIPLRIVFYRFEEDPNVVFAHCLDFDIVSEGPDPDRARLSVMEAIELYVETKLDHGEADSLYRPAPAEAWNQPMAEHWIQTVAVTLETEPDTNRRHARAQFLDGTTRLGRLALA